MILEPCHRVRELLERGRKTFLHVRDRLWRADAGDDVLPLRVDEKLAPETGLAGRRVAREGNAGSRVVALVPEHHLHDVHGRAKVVGDPVGAPVHLRARCLPGVEDRSHGALELVAGVLWEVRAERLVPGDELPQVLGVELDVLGDAALCLEGGKLLFEELAVDARHDVAEHLHQPAVGVEREPLVARRAREPLDSLVVQAEVEDRVHHARHRDGRPRAHRNEQRVPGVAEALARPLLEPRDRLVDLAGEAVGERASQLHVLAAGLGRHGEARRHRQADRGHLREADALAAEHLAAEPAPLGEVIDVLHAHCRPGRQFSHSGDAHALRRVCTENPSAGE